MFKLAWHQTWLRSSDVEAVVYPARHQLNIAFFPYFLFCFTTIG